ncbi:MAG TPA: HAMP domain-containing sensor histidine kinase [Rhodopila sp.]
MLLAKTIRSTTLKLALLWILLFGAVVAGLLGYVYSSTSSYVRKHSDRAIAIELASLQKAFDRAGRSGLITAIAQRTGDQRFGDSVYLLTDASYAPLAGNLHTWPQALRGASGSGDFDTREWKPASIQRPLLRASFATLPDGSHLLAGEDIGDLGVFVDQIKIALGLSILLIFVLAGVSALSITRRTVGRIEAINSTSRAIMQSGLGKRIPLRGTRDEWDQLAGNLNSMLERIEELMAEVKQVTENVAHDLRTPLARMRGRLEKADGRPHDAENDTSLIENLLADLDGVLRMFASLMRISQIETIDRTAAFRTVDLAEIAGEVVELYDAAAEDKGSHLDIVADRRVCITGDKDLLFDAVANLLDNAIKHGREAGHVSVEITESDGCAVLSIADDGSGIPRGEYQHVLKRFYRLERNRGTPGNGLGLSLVAAVARLHGARIEMLDNAPGLVFRIWFPLPVVIVDMAKEYSASPAA